MVRQTKINSNAKVNLALRITGKRPDGYHTLSTLFQEIDFHDEIIFKPADEFDFICSDKSLPVDKKNLCVAAYYEMKKYYAGKQEFRITLEKNVPVGAGLGGGSSNGAAVIKFLNTAWGLNFDKNKLMKIALALGCDLPFYINGKTQIAEGVGEILQPVKFSENFVFLLVLPQIAISTVWAYKNFNLTNRKEGFKFARFFQRNNKVWKMFENQFEDIVFRSYPKIGELKQKLIKNNALYAGLSGSGSTVVGIFSNKKKAREVQSRFHSNNTIISLPIF